MVHFVGCYYDRSAVASCIRLSVYQKPSFRPPHLWHIHHSRVGGVASAELCHLSTDNDVTNDDDESRTPPYCTAMAGGRHTEQA